MADAGSGPVPLARLLAMSFQQLIDDLHVRLAVRGWTDVRPAFGFANRNDAAASATPVEPSRSSM